MRYLLLHLLLLCAFQITAQSPMITEIHYDNNYDQTDPFGIDSIEYVEIYINDPQPALTDFVIARYDPDSGDPSIANFANSRDLTTTLRTESTPNGMYYVVEFQDSTFFGFPTGGINDGESGLALVELGTPNIVHQFWRYETCDPFTAVDGPAAGAESDAITTDFSRACGAAGVSLVQMNSALSTYRSIQQNGFGDWYLASNTSRMSPLENAQNVPVELLDFSGKRIGAHIDLQWSTASEVNNDYFEIQHSTNGVEFRRLAQIQGVGESSDTQEYEYLHRNTMQSYNYYRLIQHDYNGVSEIIGNIVVTSQADTEIVVYPSTTDHVINVDGAKIDAQIEIYDSSGSRVISTTIKGETIDVSSLRSGIYFVRIENKMLRFSKI